MLSTSAFNALLKTLEEPPEHVVFILATTELQKLPTTIISRCQRFDFRRISTEVLKNHLLRVASSEGIELEESAAILLAKQAQGGMRDAISLLDLCAGNRERIDEELVNNTVGKIGRENMLRVVRAIAERDYETIFSAIDEVVQSSRDISVFWQDLISVYRDLLIVKSSSNATAYLDLTDSETKALTSLAASFTIERLSYHCTMLQEAMSMMSSANSVRRISAELTLVKMCDERLNSSPEAMLSRISEVEAKMATGNFTVSAPVAEKASEPTPVKVEETSSAAKPTRPARRAAFVEDDDDEMFRGDAPGAPVPNPTPTSSQIAPKSAPAQPVQKPASSPASSGNVRVLKPFRSRAEVVEKMEAIDPMKASFISMSKWYSDEMGRLVLKFTSPFEIDTVKQFQADELFIKVVSQVVGKQYSKADLMMECAAEQKSDSVIDKILEAADSDI